MIQCRETQLARPRGFSLIELVIVMLIISILAALALPTYQRYIARGNRAVAKVFLSDLAQRQASFFADRQRFARTLSDVGFTDATGGSLGSTAWLDENGSLTNAVVAGKSLYSVSLVLSPVASSGATSVRTCAGLGSGPDAASYRLRWAATAVPVETQVERDKTCATLCLNSNGRQGASGVDGWQTCWRR